MKTFFITIFILLFLLLAYSLVGTSGKVQRIQTLAPQQMEERGWKILRYEGFQFGAWWCHGGRVWYHVQNIDSPSIQYRVEVCLWGDQLQWYYGEPETLNRIDLNLKK